MPCSVYTFTCFFSLRRDHFVYIFQVFMRSDVSAYFVTLSLCEHKIFVAKSTNDFSHSRSHTDCPQQKPMKNELTFVASTKFTIRAGNKQQMSQFMFTSFSLSLLLLFFQPWKNRAIIYTLLILYICYEEHRTHPRKNIYFLHALRDTTAVWVCVF